MRLCSLFRVEMIDLPLSPTRTAKDWQHQQKTATKVFRKVTFTAK